ncbi:MAG: TlpA disulfide reductase family protein [Chloroflexi bacterium]|nr:TlpA disulfide reductase family protein [Chloroflexota bacterium]MDA1239313.1 TlpA disulfide reductase family protein [Chloroflexota bacterium]
MTTASGLLGAGEIAPDFTLAAADGERYALAGALARGSVLLTFFSLDCQACDAAYLHWDAAFEAYAGDDFSLWAVGLDPEPQAAAFWEKSGVSFPVLFDEGASVGGYRLASTPSHVLVGQDGRVVTSFDAWDRLAWNGLLAEIASRLGRPAIEVAPGDAPEFRPGCTVHAG